LNALARRSPIPVEVEVSLEERPPGSIEAAVYYVVSEALTNAIKHSHASAIAVTIRTDRARSVDAASDGRTSLYATVADDGIGGAAPTEGSGLTGAGDRVDALGGRFILESRTGHGTVISIELPIGAAHDSQAVAWEA
jgi:signal transduction histidine kinase